MDDFNLQLKELIKNIYSEIQRIEKEELKITPDSQSPLGKILSEITIDNIQINSMLDISDTNVEKQKVISFLTGEMQFLNSKYPNSTANLSSSKWLKLVSIVLESIANYFKIPYWDILQEIVKLGAVICWIPRTSRGTTTRRLIDDRP